VAFVVGRLWCRCAQPLRRARSDRCLRRRFPDHHNPSRTAPHHTRSARHCRADLWFAGGLGSPRGVGRGVSCRPVVRRWAQITTRGWHDNFCGDVRFAGGRRSPRVILLVRPSGPGRRGTREPYLRHLMTRGTRPFHASGTAGGLDLDRASQPHTGFRYAVRRSAPARCTSGSRATWRKLWESLLERQPSS
jgi:hypothetical protein